MFNTFLFGTDSFFKLQISKRFFCELKDLWYFDKAQMSCERMLGNTTRQTGWKGTITTNQKVDTRLDMGVAMIRISSLITNSNNKNTNTERPKVETIIWVTAPGIIPQMSTSAQNCDRVILLLLLILLARLLLTSSKERTRHEVNLPMCWLLTLSRCWPR